MTRGWIIVKWTEPLDLSQGKRAVILVDVCRLTDVAG
jgi:hypothetical protein